MFTDNFSHSHQLSQHSNTITAKSLIKITFFRVKVMAYNVSNVLVKLQCRAKLLALEKSESVAKIVEAKGFQR